MTKLTAVDLFAGGGGLTVGLKRAGFRVAAAIESDESAHATYVANHGDVRAFLQDIRTTTGGELIAHEKNKRVDIVSGCPPCQGFTSLTSKYKKRDPRNALINDMLRIIKDLRPSAVMMENVPGLAIRGKARFAKFLRELKREGYLPTIGVLQVADYGVPQFRRRLVLLAGRGFEIPMPQATHAKGAADGKQAWQTVRSAIGGMPRPVKFSELRKKRISPQTTDWHIVRDLTPENQARIKVARAGQDWSSIPSHLRPRCHRGGYFGFGNVYGRMRWVDASPTITGGCTTFSKGRFGHPQADRTISVREAALLQTFPRDYLIDTSSIEDACNIVGNALPCDFAEALSKQCRKYILKDRRKRKRIRNG
jgi:DNA (cytosine-5)-methyltransferase 1